MRKRLAAATTWLGRSSYSVSTMKRASSWLMVISGPFLGPLLSPGPWSQYSESRRPPATWRQAPQTLG